LEAAFTLADEDKSGGVDQKEFVQLMKLIHAGKVSGLGRAGWFMMNNNERDFKIALATEVAKEAHVSAVAEAKEAAVLAEKSKIAAAKLAAVKAKASTKDSAARGKAGALQEKSEDKTEELFWRHLFENEASRKGYLNKKQFNFVVTKLSLRMLKTSTFNQEHMPDSNDLDAAFEVADEDRSGGVDEDEFVNIMKVIKTGGAKGLSSGNMFSASSEKAVKFRAALKETEAAADAKIAKEMQDTFEKGAAGDEVAKAQADADALAAATKEAQRRTKAAEEEAAAAKAKAAYLNGDVETMLNGEGVGLGEYADPLSKHEVDTVGELSGLSDEWLAENLGLTSSDHQAKFREVVTDKTSELKRTASDGFKGTADDVKAHEDKLRELAANEAQLRAEAEAAMEAERALAAQEIKPDVRPAPAGNMTTTLSAPVRLNDDDRILMRIYEAEDGFRGTYDEVLAHESKVAKGGKSGGAMDNDDRNDRVLLRIYEAADGFRGSYDEVLEHEKKINLARNGKSISLVTVTPTTTKRKGGCNFTRHQTGSVVLTMKCSSTKRGSTSLQRVIAKLLRAIIPRVRRTKTRINFTRHRTGSVVVTKRYWNTRRGTNSHNKVMLPWVTITGMPMTR